MIEHEVQQLGNYRLIRRLGEGGFAEVYLGEHVYLKTYAAIKVLQTQLASDKQEAFLAEARSIARLKHANIVRVLEFGVEDHTPFLVMDYAPNGSLRQRHPTGTRLQVADILPYVKQVSAALQYAHDHKLIHCDVKPENMLLGPRNEVLLSDFGIAQVVQSTRSHNTQEIVGTITYMAPEQFQDWSLPASDQYALGAVVYEWLSGDFPFHGSFTEIASQHLLVPPPPFDKRGLDILPAIEEVVMKALVKDPGQRFSSVQEFATALEQAYQQGQRTVVTLPATSSPSPALVASLPTEHATQPVPSPQHPSNDAPQPVFLRQKPASLRLSVRTILLLIIVALFAMASGSGLTYYAAVLHPTQTGQAQATITARPWATATAAKALQDIYIRATSGKLVFASTLGTNDSYNWLEYDSKDFGNCTFKGGAYHASTSLGSPYDFCTPLENTNFSNFAFQAEMTIVRGDMGGLVFRGSQSGSYSFFIGQDGSYIVIVTNAVGAQTTLLNSFSSAIKIGLNQTNLIAVVARGSSFYFYVNKQYIARVSDSTSSTGAIGVAAQNAKQVTEVAFRNVQIWNL